MAYTHLITEVGERFVGSVTLNRPDHLNTFTSLLAEELATALLAMDNDPKVRVILIKGAGKAFCAGSDIALLEVKGAHLSGNDDDVEKTKAIHRDYGRVYMVGRARGELEFRFLRELGGKLQGAGPFSIDAMRYP